MSSNLQGHQKILFYKIDHSIRAFSKQLINLHNKYEMVNMPASHWALQAEQLLHIGKQSTYSKWPVQWLWYEILNALPTLTYFSFMNISIKGENYQF